jgi:transcription termination factor Rho
MSKTELNELAKTFDVATPVKIKKDDLVAQILEIQAQRSGLEITSGVLDILPEGYGFLRRSGYLPGADDIYISQSQIRRFELRRGDLVAGQVRKPKDNEKYYGIVKVESVNDFDPESVRERRTFEDLTPVVSAERYTLEHRGAPLGVRMVDLFSPIGKGARGLVLAPASTGKSRLLKAIADALFASAADTHVILLAVDERPEDVTELLRAVDGEIVATSFDDPPDSHVTVAELALERAKRLLELGQDVVLLVDSLTRLMRAYSAAPAARATPATDGGSPLHKLKRFFGSARSVEEGGSLTILATVVTENGNTLDEVAIDELRAIANVEIRLLRELADARVFPAIDVKRSGARSEEQLLSELELRKVGLLRRAITGLAPVEAAEALLVRFGATKTNSDFLGALTEKSVAALATT